MRECVSIYLELGEAEEKLKRLEEYLSALTDIWGEKAVLAYRVEEIGSDWKYKYQRFFRAKKVTDTIVVSPPWEDCHKGEGEILIKILPGAAFGTGIHETTRLSLIAMERIFSNARINSLLDVGTGSGILAVAGALLGAGRVLAIDIDEDAVNSALDNAIRNGVQDIVEVRHKTFGDKVGESLQESFDLVVSNISGEVIKGAADSLLTLTNPGGYLVLSGFLSEEADEVLNAFGEVNSFLTTKDKLGEWSSITVENTTR